MTVFKKSLLEDWTERGAAHGKKARVVTDPDDAAQVRADVERALDTMKPLVLANERITSEEYETARVAYMENFDKAYKGDDHA